MEQASARKMRFSYSTLDQPFLQRAIIQTIEKLGGQRKLKKLYVRHQENIGRGENFFDSAMSLLKIAVEYDPVSWTITEHRQGARKAAQHLL